ncbi:hypothetical protein BJ165DRAFT_1415930 [Panaeolus papilionaceus]|nr:hypothetical protein BJ165DRAFT_1415930 [Panaeolus papilionaceus]
MSSPELPFTPRKEFIRDQQHSLNSFALLAISSANCIRLYSFTPSLVRSIRSLLDAAVDTEQNLCEVASVATEKLLVDIIAIIYQYYAMAFSKSTGSPSASPPPLSSSSSLVDKPKPKRIPFALSFGSTTLMRSVRNSWPRGVVSEKKVGENTFEFKLKGYKCPHCSFAGFQQDTFATDSLRHILSLLSSLDQHSFTLLTSISLTNRSRVKDLWIFTGPAPDNAPADLSQSFLQPSASLRRLTPPSDTLHQHRRQVTEPLPITPQTSLTYTHPARAATENNHQRPPPQSPHVPVSVIQRDSDIPDEVVPPPVQPIRAYMPSNMTGIGARPLGINNETFSAQIQKPLTSPPQSRPLRPVSERAKTPPLKTPPSPTMAESKNEQYKFPTSPDPHPPNLLGFDAFRDSGHTDISHDDGFPSLDTREKDASERSLHWNKSNRAPATPILPGGWQPTPISESGEDHFPGYSTSNPSSPVKPAMHQSSSGTSSEKEKTPASVSTPIYENVSRVEAPEIVSPDSAMALRKSEAALVGIINSTVHASPEPVPIPAIIPMQSSFYPQREPMHRMASSNSAHSNAGQTSLNGGSGSGSGGGGQGWVMVNVDSMAKSATAEYPVSPVTATISTSTGSGTTMQQMHAPEPIRAVPSEASHMSGTSKLSKSAIVIIDAMDSKHKKAKSTSQTKDSSSDRSTGGGVRRFFSLHRKNSKKVLDDIDETPGSDAKTPAETSVARSNLRDRLRLLGTPQAARREDKRRSSID